MKKLNKLGIAALLGFAPVALLNAAPYVWELGGSYETRDTDVNDVDINEDNLSFDATYYFQRVDTAGLSLHEAPFVQRASYISLGAHIDNIDDELNNAVDTDTYSLNTALINRDSGWYLKLGYINSDADVEPAGGANAAVVGYRPAFDGYRIAGGRYLFENTTLEVGYTEIDVDGDFFIQGGNAGDNDTIGVGVKHYGALTGAIAFSVEANYYFVDLQVGDFDQLDDSGEVYSATFTVYPMRELAIGLSYADADDLMGRPYLTSTSSITDGLGVLAEWFFTENFSVHAIYNNREYDIANLDNLDEPGEVDGDSLLFGAKFRF